MSLYKQQVDLLINKMTTKEKIGQCVMFEPDFCYKSWNEKEHQGYTGISDPRLVDRLVHDYNIGFLLFGGVTRVGNDLDTDWAAYIHQVNNVAKNSRLGIPPLFGVDAVHGANFIKETTIYTHNLGVASTWNPELAKKYMSNVSDELYSIGINCNFAPTIDIARDQRWGRVYESLGEDPFLASKISEAFVRGLQKEDHVAACAKHFIGYGESCNGMDRIPADLSDRSIRESHLPPFEAAIKAGVKTIMVNGGDVNGTPMPASKKLMTSLLREELGFEGIVLSDWEDVYRLYDRHKTVSSRKEAVAKAFNAGLDMNMVVSDIEIFPMMEELIDEGIIKMERLDEAVRRILNVKFELGLFENSNFENKLSSDKVYRDEAKKIAYDLAKESMILLKNNDNLLPLSKEVKSILVTGKTANSKRHLCGGWTLNWASANEEDLSFDTILESLKKYVGDHTSITHIEKAEDIKTINPSDYDLCISVVGEEPHSEWLGDSFDMLIEEDEFNMLLAVKETGLKTVMVSLLGRPTKLTWMDENMDAILWAYTPGSEGQRAIVETLFGENNPSGKTPISFPKDPNQIPVYYSLRRYVSGWESTKYDPLYPFGYGLSYTSFSYTNLILPDTIIEGKSVQLSVDVTNIGDVEGSEVVQVYFTDEYASVTRPLSLLKGFDKVHLNPGETKTVLIPLTEDVFKLFDEELDFVYESRKINVKVQNLTKTITLK